MEHSTEPCINISKAKKCRGESGQREVDEGELKTENGTEEGKSSGVALVIDD